MCHQRQLMVVIKRPESICDLHSSIEKKEKTSSKSKNSGWCSVV